MLVYESGTLGAKPDRLPLSIGDGILADTADAVIGVPEVFNYWLQAGPHRRRLPRRCAARPVRQHQHHGHRRATTDDPKVRLPGAGGAPEIAASCREVLIIMRQSTRSFVERVDFVTSFGYGTGPGEREQLGLRGRGPVRVITDLGVLEPDPQTCELTLTAVHPGSHRRRRSARTPAGISRWPSDLATTDAPTDEELDILRALQKTLERTS